MRDVLEQGLGWAVVVGIVLGVILGRRRGREQRAAAISSAVAQARQDWQAELSSLASANVVTNVAVDASRRGALALHEAGESCPDPWGCPACAPVLRRVAELSYSVPTADHRALGYYYGPGRHDDHDGAGYDDDNGLGGDGIPVARSRPRQDDGRGSNGRPDARVLRAGASEACE